MSSTDLPSPESMLDKKRRRMLIAVWVALAVWTLLLSIGTSLYAPAPGGPKQPSVDWRRGLMVFIFVGGFQSLWMWLATRKRLPRRFRDSLTVTEHGQTSIEGSQEQDSQQSHKDG